MRNQAAVEDQMFVFASKEKKLSNRKTLFCLIYFIIEFRNQVFKRRKSAKREIILLDSNDVSYCYNML